MQGHSSLVRTSTKCRRHRWVYSACHTSLELKDESTTKEDILNCHFDFNLLLQPSVSLSNSRIIRSNRKCFHPLCKLRCSNSNWGIKWDWFWTKNLNEQHKCTESKTELVGFLFYLVLFWLFYGSMNQTKVCSVF